MNNKWIRTFEGRIAWYTVLSLLVTCVVEFLFALIIYRVVGTLRYMGYRSAMLGPDGLYPGYRLLILGATGVITFLLTFYVLIHKYMVYVRLLERAMRDIANGDLNQEIPVKNLDEFGEMARYMNQMECHVKELMERERESEQTKNDLVTSVAHDLRTPLTSVIGYLDWVKSRPDLDVETRQQYLDIAHRKALHLEQLTNELFGFVKMEHKDMTLHIETLDLQKLLEQLLDEAWPSFEKHGLEARFFCTETKIMMEGDGNLLARLFENLLNNAIKYGKDGKIIRVEAKVIYDRVMVRVINYGYVIPKEDLEKLFRKFYRVEQSRSQNTGGTGLGLAIVHQIAELHGGDVQVKSDLDGTAFTVMLPLKQTKEKKE